MLVDNVRVIIENGPFTAEDANYYINLIKKTSRFTLKKISFNRRNDYLDIRYSFVEVPFDRIRRISLAQDSRPSGKAVGK